MKHRRTVGGKGKFVRDYGKILYAETSWKHNNSKHRARATKKWLILGLKHIRMLHSKSRPKFNLRIENWSSNMLSIQSDWLWTDLQRRMDKVLSLKIQKTIKYWLNGAQLECTQHIFDIQFQKPCNCFHSLIIMHYIVSVFHVLTPGK